MKAIFLDAGLTLLRAHPSLGGVYTGVTRRFGREIPPAEFDRSAAAAFHKQAAEHRDAGEEGLRTSEALERESWRRHARRVMGGIPLMDGMEFDGWFEVLYREFGSAAVWRPYADVPPALEALRARGLRLAVLSNWDARLHGILEEGGIRPHFERVFVSSEIGWRKPHPAIFRHAMEVMGLAPGEVIHVGDSVGDDLRGAEACGIRAALIDRAGNQGTVDGIPRIRDLRGLETLLDGAPA